MTDKGADTVQVKLRVPARIRRQVLAAAKKSGRSLSSELNHLIETGLANPGDVSLVTKVAATAAAEAVVRVLREVLPVLEETPQGREALKAASASMRSPQRATVASVLAVPMDEWPRHIASLERALNDEKDPQEREKLWRLIEFSKERDFRARAKTASLRGEEK
jgi:hypothetical protein